MHPSNLKYSEYFTDLTLGLLESFYPFTNEELVKYQTVLDFRESRLIKNSQIPWNADLIDSVKDSIDFSTLYRAKDLVIDYKFLKRFENYFYFSALPYFKNLIYSEDIIKDFHSKLDWTTFLINRDGFNTIENIRKNKDYLNWDKLSGSLKYSIDKAFLDEFADYINWEKLSHNSNLKLDMELLEKYQGKFNFRNLSSNPAAAQIILKYPKSSRWHWYSVLKNEGIEINDENLDILIRYHAKEIQSIPLLINKPMEITKRVARSNVISNLIKFRRTGTDYLYSDRFKENYIWHFISETNAEMPEGFVLDNLSKFKTFGYGFLNKNGKYFSPEFIHKNIEKFDLKQSHFYKLNITLEIVRENIEKIDFLWLSSNESIEWNPDFIYNMRDQLNFYRLCENRKVYDNLLGNWSTLDVHSFLDNYDQ
ncbi:hypothetical protein P0M11_12495 [Kaistella sp. PBT33-4]|uniref:hypothetical protein n=1 Tax=Kaistella sp. PBT33-4 TaxID=3032000 RepID=UPI0023D80F65|nr:hypothetical protein [Kaistella sp. PBT33-4]MDF0720819.1 hypothetical protein [Kaistella sp. PBT33-4]